MNLPTIMPSPFLEAQTERSPSMGDENGTSCNDYLLEKNNLDTLVTRKTNTFVKWNLHKILPWLLHLVLLTASITLFVQSKTHHTDPRYCTEKWSMPCTFALLCCQLVAHYFAYPSPAPGLYNFNDDYELIRSDNTYSSQSIYKGPPSPERDVAWDRVTHGEFLSR